MSFKVENNNYNFYTPTRLIDKELYHISANKSNYPNGFIIDFMNGDAFSNKTVKINEPVKWQVLHGAKSYTSFGNVKIDENFYVAHLNKDDLYILYKIFYQYLHNTVLDSEIKLVNQELLKIIKDQIITLCFLKTDNSDEFKAKLSVLQGSDVKEFITELDSIINLKKELKALLPNTNKGIIDHAKTWFNFEETIKDASGMTSLKVKWQLLHVAKAFWREGTIVTNNEFGVKHLSSQELAILYRIIFSYKQSCRQNDNKILFEINHHFISKIEKYLLTMSYQSSEFLHKTMETFIAQNDAQLNSMIRHFKGMDYYCNLLRCSDKKNVAISYLNKFYENIEKLQETEREEGFYYFLQSLNIAYPQLNIYKYFIDFGLHESVFNIVTLDFFDEIIDHFDGKEKDDYKYKGKLKNIDKMNVKDLTSYFNELERNNFIGEKKVLAIHRSFIGAHYTPIHLKKTLEGSHFVISDSAVVCAHWIPIIRKTITESNLKISNITTFEMGRQADHVSCPIGSFRDILESKKFDLFEYIDQTAPSLKYQRDGMTVLKHYPPQFMKIKQGLSYLKDYIKAVPDSEKTIVASKTVKSAEGINTVVNKTLEQVIRAHTVKIGHGNTNFYTRKRGFKYFIIVLKRLLNNLD